MAASLQETLALLVVNHRWQSPPLLPSAPPPAEADVRLPQPPQPLVLQGGIVVGDGQHVHPAQQLLVGRRGQDLRPGIRGKREGRNSQNRDDVFNGT